MMLGSLIVHTHWTPSQDRQRGLGVAGEQVDRGVRAPAAVAGQPARDGEVQQGHHRLSRSRGHVVDHAPVVVDLRAGDSPRSGSMRAHSMLKR